MSLVLVLGPFYELDQDSLQHLVLLHSISHQSKTANHGLAGSTLLQVARALHAHVANNRYM
jgi:hypothetical protein